MVMALLIIVTLGSIHILYMHHVATNSYCRGINATVIFYNIQTLVILYGGYFNVEYP